MAASRQDAVDRLLTENEEFKSAYEAHRECKRKVDKFEKRSRLSATEEAEKTRLKKLKLAMKDKMEKMLNEAG